MTVSRLKRRPEFLRASAKGRKAALPGVVLQALRRDDAAPGVPAGDTRVGFTVTKKVGNAVVRNRVRRRLREAARLGFRLHGAPAGTDLVLIGREGTIRRDFARLCADVETALERTGCRAPASRSS